MSPNRDRSPRDHADDMFGSPVPDLEPVELAEADVRACAELSASIGWNQMEADWLMMLRAGLGFGYRNKSRLVATAVCALYRPTTAWIAMVVVDVAYRRRGLARAMMERCMSAAGSAGLVPALDASAAGRDVYIPMGFVDGPAITRLGVDADAQHGLATFDESSARSRAVVKAATPNDLRAICDLDSENFGARRDIVLADMLKRAGQHCFVARDDDSRLTGFCLGRPGRLATQVGPIVAGDARLAEHLLARALSAIAGPVVLDVPNYHRDLQTRLRAGGFVEHRSFRRMTRPGAAARIATSTDLGAEPAMHVSVGTDVTHTFAIGGPAIG